MNGPPISKPLFIEDGSTPRVSRVALQRRLGSGASAALILVIGCGGDPDTAMMNGGGSLDMNSAGMAGQNLGGSGASPAPVFPPAVGGGGASTGGGAGTGEKAVEPGNGGTTTAGQAAAGGGGEGDDDAGGAGQVIDSEIPATFETVKFVFQGTNPPCVASDCHGSGTHHELSLAVDDQLHTTLTTHTSSACGDVPLVTPGDPQQSALLTILNGPCGEIPRMPNGCVEDEFGSTCVPDAYIAAIEAWISNGGPP